MKINHKKLKKYFQDYAINLAKQLGLRGPQTAARKLGAPLSEEDLEHLREEQIHQLYELMLAAKEEDQKKEQT